MTNYSAIAEQHTLDYGRKVANYGRILAEMLYSDRTHFIYELLQNAEDAGATNVAFTLFNERLEVRHNGRPFNENDVRAICSIGEGTKVDDITKIGKFGIGFKSVYTHTTCPYIHSGDEHFVIVDFVFPKACSAVETSSGETLIVIPFNRGDSESQTSYEHIAKRLRTLDSQTLLFLRSIQEIQWRIDDQQSGHYLRDTKETNLPSVRQVDILDEQMNVENWLVFFAPTEYERHKLGVEIAFSIETNPKMGRNQVKRISDSKLVVFFPTEKLTRFGFVMQGPYRTTPGRDNIIQDHPVNRTLIAGTADLILKAAEALQQFGLLDANALDAWVTETQPPVNWEFQPIYNAIIQVFMTHALLPTSSGDFVRGTNAKLARGQGMIALFTQQQLRVIFPSTSDVAWLHESITRDRFPRLHTFLREQVKVEEITPEKLIDRLTHPSFLSRQTDEWTIRFYTFLTALPTLWEHERSPLRGIAFIRLESGNHVLPFKPNKEPNAYLPAEGRETAFPIVRKYICDDDGARTFLERLGLRKPDLIAEVLDLILPKYGRDGLDIATDEEYLHDIEAMAEALTQANEKQRKILRERISHASVILSQNAVNAELSRYVTPDLAIARNGDCDFLYFDNSQVWYIHDLVPTKVIDVFRRNGLTHPSPVRARAADWNNRISVTSTHGLHERGLQGFDPECEIEGLVLRQEKMFGYRRRSLTRASLTPKRQLTVAF